MTFRWPHIPKRLAWRVLAPVAAFAFSAQAAEGQSTFTPIEVPGAVYTEAWGINDAGQIVGAFGDPARTRPRGFLYDAGTFTTIDVPGSIGTGVHGINAAGHIVGTYADNTGQHGFLYAGGTFTTLDVPEAPITWANAVNAAGQIVGINSDPGTSYLLYSFLYAGGRFTQACGINAGGQVVGSYGNVLVSGQSRGFLY